MFPNSEGIGVFNQVMNFVSKTNKELFTLDLEAMAWTSTSTFSGAFNLQPDQLTRILVIAKSSTFVRMEEARAISTGGTPQDSAFITLEEMGTAPRQLD
jgi:hypothetical protein